MVDAEDGLPIDDVGAWVKEKHERLRQYVDITRAVRRRFVEGTGGATYIDLYCGSARARVRDSAEIIDGSPLVAAKTARDGGAPFSNIFIADASEALCRAAEERIVRAGFSPTVEVGTAEETVGRIVKKLSPYGLHFVFLDPFNLQDLPFSVITALARLKRVDLLMHVSAQDLQRNLHSYTRPGDNRLDRFAPGWRSAVDIQRPPRVVRAGLLEYWAKKIEALGLPPARHAELISGTSKNQRLYWLVLAARHDLARQLWDIRFVSFEPLLGPIRDPDLAGIHWAIVGGESGPRARPMQAWWVEQLHNACERHRVVFFFKQWGGARKKRTGRLFKDRTWDDYPAIGARN